MGEQNDQEQLLAYKARVLAILEENDSIIKDEKDEKDSLYSVDSQRGAEICATFSDDELLELLKKSAQKLGHSPTQSEVHWILREYLRSRFRNWPGALCAAGLSKSAGRGGISVERSSRDREGYQRMLNEVRDKARALGRLPHPSELKEVCHHLKKRYRTWGEVLIASGAEEAVTGSLRKEEHLEEQDRDMLKQLRAIAETFNRSPLRSEVDESLRKALLERFGSWRNALYQIDLEPIRRITSFANAPLHREKERGRALHRKDLYDCRYRLLKLDPQTKADLELVKKLAERLGRCPNRREIPQEIRRRLQKACGSWSNALFQLGLQEKPDGNLHR